VKYYYSKGWSNKCSSCEQRIPLWITLKNQTDPKLFYVIVGGFRFFLNLVDCKKFRDEVNTSVPSSV